MIRCRDAFSQKPYELIGGEPRVRGSMTHLISTCTWHMRVIDSVCLAVVFCILQGIDSSACRLELEAKQSMSRMDKNPNPMTPYGRLRGLRTCWLCFPYMYSLITIDETRISVASCVNLIPRTAQRSCDVTPDLRCERGRAVERSCTDNTGDGKVILPGPY